MQSNVVQIGSARPRTRTFYERWMTEEGVPVIDGYAINDVVSLPMKPWPRLGCEGAFIDLHGSDGITGCYVGRLGPGQSTIPEHHLYEEIIYIIEGEGVAEIQQRDRVPQTIEWRQGSVFSPPLNTLHRLINHGSVPAVFLAVTTAPLALDHYHDADFVLHCDYAFNDRYDGAPGYFDGSTRGYVVTPQRQWVCETNFIPDVRVPQLRGGLSRPASTVTQFEIADNTLIGHLARWPAGYYRKAHYHGGGIVLLTLASTGYTLMWPSHFGMRPFAAGHADRVVRVDWRPGSVFSPPAHWFHQHFNTGAEPSLHLAFRCGSRKNPLGVRVRTSRAGVYTAVQDGGTLIDFASEDPAIASLYHTELMRKGIEPSKKIASSAVGND